MARLDRRAAPTAVLLFGPGRQPCLSTGQGGICGPCRGEGGCSAQARIARLLEVTLLRWVGAPQLKLWLRSEFLLELETVPEVLTFMDLTHTGECAGLRLENGQLLVASTSDATAGDVATALHRGMALQAGWRGR